jgi:hypothetical protein
MRCNYALDEAILRRLGKKMNRTVPEELATRTCSGSSIAEALTRPEKDVKDEMICQ